MGLGAIILLGLVGNIGQAANQALVPDLLPRERHEAGYATVRVVQNLGVVLRGAYIGAFGSTFAIGFALTPFVGLQVRGASGDAAMWVMFTCLAVAGAIVGFVACTRAFGLTGAAEGELEEMAVAAG